MSRLTVAALCTLFLASSCSSQSPQDDPPDGPPSSTADVTTAPNNGQGAVHIFATGSGAEEVVDSGGMRLVDDVGQWNDLQNSLRVTGGSSPEINFPREKGLVIARQVNSGGHRLVPTDIKAADGRAVVTLEIRTPGPGCVTTQAIQHLWVAIRVPYETNDVDVQEQRLPGEPC